MEFLDFFEIFTARFRTGCVLTSVLENSAERKIAQALNEGVLMSTASLNGKQAVLHDHPRKHWDLCHGIIEVFYAVYNELGFGFLEAVYEEALAVALTEAGFTVARQVPVPVWFRGKKIGEYRADLIVNGSVILELKAARNIDPSHEAQSLNYLRATDVEVALLLNFGPKPQFRRYVFENNRKKIRVHSR